MAKKSVEAAAAEAVEAPVVPDVPVITFKRKYPGETVAQEAARRHVAEEVVVRERGFRLANSTGIATSQADLNPLVSKSIS